MRLIYLWVACLLSLGCTTDADRQKATAIVEMIQDDDLPWEIDDSYTIRLDGMQVRFDGYPIDRGRVFVDGIELESVRRDSSIRSAAAKRHEQLLLKKIKATEFEGLDRRLQQLRKEQAALTSKPAGAP